MSFDAGSDFDVIWPGVTAGAAGFGSAKMSDALSLAQQWRHFVRRMDDVMDPRRDDTTFDVAGAGDEPKSTPAS